MSGRSRARSVRRGVCQHERVEPVVLVPGRAVTAAQVVDLVGADHHDGESGVEEDVDDLAVAAFDRDLADAGAASRWTGSRSPAPVASMRNCSVIDPRLLTMATA